MNCFRIQRWHSIGVRIGEDFQFQLYRLNKIQIVFMKMVALYFTLTSDTYSVRYTSVVESFYSMDYNWITWKERSLRNRFRNHHSCVTFFCLPINSICVASRILKEKPIIISSLFGKTLKNWCYLECDQCQRTSRNQHHFYGFLTPQLKYFWIL